METGGEREPQDWGWLAGQEECACCQAAFKRGYVGFPQSSKTQCKERRGQDGRKDRGMVAGEDKPEWRSMGLI